MTKSHFEYTEENKPVDFEQTNTIYFPDYEAYLERKEKAKAKANALWGYAIFCGLTWSFIVWLIFG